MVREKWFADRSPSRAAPSQGRSMPCIDCPAGLRVPVFCLLLVRLVCARTCAWGGSNGLDPARCVHTCCRSPGIHLPRLDSTGTCQGPGVEALAGQTREIERAKPKPREGVSVCAGAALLSCFKPPTPHPHNTRTIHLNALLSLVANGTNAPPSPLSEHGLTNTSSNEYHHHDLDHATTSRLFIINNLSPVNPIPTSGFSHPAFPKCRDWGAGLAWPGRLHRYGIGKLQVLWLSQVRPMCVCKLISPQIRRPVDSVSLSLCISVRNLPSDYRVACNMTGRNFLCHLSSVSTPCMHALQPRTRPFPLKLLRTNPRS